MRYTIKILCKNGKEVIAQNLSAKSLNSYVRQAEEYGDKVLSIKEVDSSGNTIKDLILSGAGFAVGLVALNEIIGAFDRK